MYICPLLLDQLLHAICCLLLSIDEVPGFRIQTVAFLNKMSKISQICCPIWLFVAILQSGQFSISVLDNPDSREIYMDVM
jgi:hypothetical protein